MWDRSVFTQYSYYRVFFCSRPSSRHFDCHRHMWVRYIDTKKIIVWCVSSLLLSIDLWQLCYFIMFYLKMTNGAIVKWWMVKWCHGEMKISTGHFFSHKYQIFSFVYFRTHHFCSRQSNPSFSIFDHYQQVQQPRLSHNFNN